MQKLGEGWVVVGDVAACCLQVTLLVLSLCTQYRVDVIEVYGGLWYYGKRRVQLSPHTVSDEDNIVPVRSN